MDKSTSPKFLHLHDLGLSLQHSGRKPSVRKTLIRKGQEFAEANGLHIFWVGRDGYISTSQLDRLIEEAA